MVTLLPLESAHARVLSDASQDAEFLRGLLYKAPLNLQEAEEDIAAMLRLERDGDMIVRSIHVDDRVIGRIGARKRGDRWVLFYWIIPSHQEQGFGYEALQQFLILAPRPLYAEVFPWNERSVKLLQKVGAAVHATVYRIEQ